MRRTFSFLATLISAAGLAAVLVSGCSNDRSEYTNAGSFAGKAGVAGAAGTGTRYSGGTAGKETWSAGGGIGGNSTSGGTTNAGVAGIAAAAGLAGSAGLKNVAGTAGMAGGAASAAGTTNTAGTRNIAGAAGSGAPVGSAGQIGVAGAAGQTNIASPFTRLTATVDSSLLRAILPPTGQTATSTIAVTIAREGSQDGAVNLSVTGLPSNVGFTPEVIAPGVTSALVKVNVGATASVGGPYNINLVASGAIDSTIASKVPLRLVIAQVAGAMDTGFGGSGVVSVKVASAASDGTLLSDYPKDIAIDDQSRVIIGGATDSRGWVARFTSSGALDPKFGTNGVTYGFGTPNSRVVRVATISNQTFAAVNVQRADSTVVNYLRKISESGETDTGFGGGVEPTFSSEINDLMPYRSGLLAAPSTSAPVLYTISGAVDSSWKASSDAIAQVTNVDTTGNVVFAARNPTNSGISLGRLLPTGAADSSFTGGGSVSVPCPAKDPLNVFAAQPAAVVTVSSGGDPKQPVTLALVNCGRSERDPFDWEASIGARSMTGSSVNFGPLMTDPMIVASPGWVRDAIVQSDNKLVLLYESYSGDASSQVYQYYLARYDWHGKPDTTFGNGGIVDLSILPSQAFTYFHMAYEPVTQRLVLVRDTSSIKGITVTRIWL